MSSELPEGWEKHVSKSTGTCLVVFVTLTLLQLITYYLIIQCQIGRTYYLNVHTKQSQWEIPTESSTSYKRVRCSHLLVKHRDSRRPSSWRSDNITRTKEEAVELLECIYNVAVISLVATLFYTYHIILYYFRF